MFKKYIQDIAKHEARKILSSNYKEKIKNLEHDNITSKALYSKEKLEKNKLLFNTYGLEYEIKILKKEISELELLNEKLNKENKELLVTPANTITEELYILKSENEKIKNILSEIHEICDSTWGVKLPYFEVRSLLNKIREISKIG